MCVYRFQKDEKELYEAFQNALADGTSEVLKRNTNTSNAYRMYRRALSSAPDSYGFQGTCKWVNGTCEYGSYGLLPIRKIQDDFSLKARILLEADWIIKEARKQPSTEAGIFWIYSYFARSFQYDNEKTERWIKHAPASPFLRRKAVCDGFSQALAFVLNRYGVDTGIVVGDLQKKSGEEVEGDPAGTHMWNILKLGRDYYHLDVTCDLESKPGKIGSFCYYLLSDEQMARDHYWKDPTLPPCRDSSMEYYTRRNLVAENEEELGWILNRKIRDRESNIIVRTKGFTLKGQDVKETFNRLVPNWSEVASEVHFEWLTKDPFVSFGLSYREPKKSLWRDIISGR